jgi:hypothetical protein
MATAPDKYKPKKGEAPLPNSPPVTLSDLYERESYKKWEAYEAQALDVAHIENPVEGAFNMLQNIVSLVNLELLTKETARRIMHNVNEEEFEEIIKLTPNYYFDSNSQVVKEK